MVRISIRKCTTNSNLLNRQLYFILAALLGLLRALTCIINHKETHSVNFVTLISHFMEIIWMFVAIVVVVSEWTHFIGTREPYTRKCWMRKAKRCQHTCSHSNNNNNKYTNSNNINEKHAFMLVVVSYILLCIVFVSVSPSEWINVYILYHKVRKPHIGIDEIGHLPDVRYCFNIKHTLMLLLLLLCAWNSFDLSNRTWCASNSCD